MNQHCQEKLPLLFPARVVWKNVVARLSLCLEEDGAANLGHEALADVAPEILYNIFCAGCQGEFFAAGFFPAGFFSGRFFWAGLRRQFFLARIEDGVGTPAQPD